MYGKHLAHCTVSTVLLEPLNTSLFTQKKGMRTTGPVHLLFPLARMFFPSLHSLPFLLLHQFLRPARQILLIYLSVIRVYDTQFQEGASKVAFQEGASKVALTAKQTTGTITHGCPCVYKSNCSRCVQQKSQTQATVMKSNPLLSSADFFILHALCFALLSPPPLDFLNF